MSDEKAKVYVIAHREVEYGLLNDKIKHTADYHKVGISENVKRRLSYLGSGTPHELELVTTINVDQPEVVEDYLHRYIDRFGRDRGEWFKLSTNELNSLKSLDYIQGDNMKRAYYNRTDYDRRVSLYILIQKARMGELPSFQELTA